MVEEDGRTNPVLSLRARPAVVEALDAWAAYFTARYRLPRSRAGALELLLKRTAVPEELGAEARAVREAVKQLKEGA